MSYDLIRNVQGFEIANGMDYFTNDIFTRGGVVGTLGPPFPRPPNVGSHDICLFAFGTGWLEHPVRYGANGVTEWSVPADLNDSGIFRIYWAPVFAPPGLDQTVFLLAQRGVFITARIEVDALMELSVDGVKGPLPTTLVVGTYYRLEFLYDNNTGERELRINGVTEFTDNGAVQHFDMIQFGDERGGRNFLGSTWDDVLMLVQQIGSIPKSWPGEGEVHRLYATGEGTDVGWVLGAGANKTAAVSEDPPDGDISYIHNNGVAAEQTYDIDPISGIIAASIIPGALVKAVKVTNLVRRFAGATDWHHARIRSGLTVDQTTLDTNSPAGYESRGVMIRGLDPNTGAPWTGAAVDAMEAGIATPVTVATGRDTNLVVEVDIGSPFPLLPGRAKINPPTLGPSGPSMIGAGTVGG